MAYAALPVRRLLGRWSRYPTLAVARAALDVPGSEDAAAMPRPVDPDAIVLPTDIPDRVR